MQRFLLLCFAAGMSLAPCAHAQEEPREEFMRARVAAIVSENADPSPEDPSRRVQVVQLNILSGPDRGVTFSAENGVLRDREDMRLQKGETVVVRKIVRPDGTFEYVLGEKYRLPSVVWLTVFFAALAVVLGRKTGASSLFGLAVSVLILALFVVPQIANGRNPLVISMIGSCVIACTSLYLAHGFHRRTSVALASTLFTLALAAILSVVFVHVGKLFGMGSEEAMYLQTGPLGQINLRGILLGGIIIGCLGVLDDITTAQTAAVDEIRKANPALSEAALLRAGFSVGREHIASLINTLALAYVGASLPLLLLFKANEAYPLWVTLNSEFLSEEIIRTLVGSTTLLLAVPISTWFAVRLLGASSSAGRPHHGHHHGISVS